MIRPVTCLAFLLACSSGLYLYQSKHRVKVLDDQIATMVKSTDTLREQTRMLSAEWTLLNDPLRLRQLANQFLALQTVSPNQFTSLADLDSRLPPPLPQGAPPAPAAPLVAEQAPSATVAAPAAIADADRAAAAKLAATAAPVKGAAPALALASAKDATVPAAAARDAAIATRIAASALPDGAHGADRHPAPHPVPPLPHVVASQPRPPEPRWEDRRPIEPREVAQRSFVPRTMEQRPVMATRLPQPYPAMGGSLLGMAHDAAAPPRPMPLPQPIVYGGSGG